MPETQEETAQDHFIYYQYFRHNEIETALYWFKGLYTPSTPKEDVLHIYPDGSINVMRGVGKNCAIALAEVKKLLQIPVELTCVTSRYEFEQQVQKRVKQNADSKAG